MRRWPTPTTPSGTASAPWTTGLTGLVCLVAAAAFARELPRLRDVLHPIYARMGILPRV